MLNAGPGEQSAADQQCAYYPRNCAKREKLNADFESAELTLGDRVDSLPSVSHRRA
jgi:hypothetical protein